MMGLGLLETTDRPLSVLCIGAHADDIEIGCGGTILDLLERRPASVRWEIFSADDVRSAEATRSAEVYLAAAEAADVTIHGLQDGLFPAQRAEIKRVFGEIQEGCTPDVIFTHDERDLHQDHQLLGALTRETFRDHLVLEYEIPKYDGGLRSPNVFVPLGAAVRRRKVELLMDAFVTQRAKRWFEPQVFNGLMRLRGVECASQSGYAEGFHCRKLLVHL